MQRQLLLCDSHHKSCLECVDCWLDMFSNITTAANGKMYDNISSTFDISIELGKENHSKECRISVRGETLYLTMLSAVTPTQ